MVGREADAARPHLGVLDRQEVLGLDLDPRVVLQDSPLGMDHGHLSGASAERQNDPFAMIQHPDGLIGSDVNANVVAKVQ